MFTLAYKSPKPTPTDITHLRVTSAVGNIPSYIQNTTYTSNSDQTRWFLDGSTTVDEQSINKNGNTYTLDWGWVGGWYEYTGNNPWTTPWQAVLLDPEDDQEHIMGTAINVVPYIPE